MISPIHVISLISIALCTTSGTFARTWKSADGHHVYALEWNKDAIKWWVNGAVVHEMKNTHWHQPLNMMFDSETFPDWFGLPDKATLPATFSIEYIRSWSGPEDG